MQIDRYIFFSLSIVHCPLSIVFFEFPGHVPGGILGVSVFGGDGFAEDGPLRNADQSGKTHLVPIQAGQSRNRGMTSHAEFRDERPFGIHTHPHPGILD